MATDDETWSATGGALRTGKDPTLPGPRRDSTGPANAVHPLAIGRPARTRPAVVAIAAAVLFGIVVIKPWTWGGDPRSPAFANAGDPAADRFPHRCRSGPWIPPTAERNQRPRIVVSSARPGASPGPGETKVIPMTHPLRTLGALALGASIVAVAALSVRSGPVAGAPETDPAPHTITVSGTGKITLVPDVARVQLGVTIARPTVKAARDAGAKAMTDIIATIKSLGIAEADIKTTNLSLYPQYGNGSAPKVVGYQISEQVQVTVRDLDKTGDVVDGATAHGATDVNGISFEVADPVKAQNDARAAAVTAARASAEAMATAGHVSLGAVVSITDATPIQSPIFYNYGAAQPSAADAATPVKPGTQDLGATVTVVFAIL